MPAIPSVTEAPILHTYARFPLTLIRGKGSHVWDDAGRSYLDFCSGIAVCSLGHCHPVLVEAIERQARQLIHVSNLYHTTPAAELASYINKQVGLPGRSFFANSGAEANDGLIKLARRFGNATAEAEQNRTEIITFNQSFHGRTIGGIAATGQQKVKDGFSPLLPGFRHLPFGDLSILEEAICNETCAILLEPVQGEGGVHPATPEFLRGVASLCKQHNLLLLLDEVQCGFGRLGDMMAWKALGVPELEPDGISWAKGMGGGVPIGSFWVNDRTIDDSGTTLSSLLGPGSHGSTYGGNPLVTQASLAVLKEIENAGLPAQALEREQQIREQIESWQHPLISNLRGKGLLLGIVLNDKKISPPKGQTPAAQICHAALKNGLLIPPAGANVVRLLPPLTVSPQEIEEALSILKSVLDSHLVE